MASKSMLCAYKNAEEKFVDMKDPNLRFDINLIWVILFNFILLIKSTIV